MKHALFLLSALALSIPIVASPLTFHEAKLKADSSERSLSSSDIQTLVNTQGQFASTAFPTCAKRTGAEPTDFTVVVEIDMQGSVVNSWRQGESKFAKCFQDMMEQSFSYRPRSQPFFTSFEYSNAQ